MRFRNHHRDYSAHPPFDAALINRKFGRGCLKSPLRAFVISLERLRGYVKILNHKGTQSSHKVPQRKIITT